MSDERFELMRRILAAPSPIGLEGAMTRGVLEPHFQTFIPDTWKIHTFKGNAGIDVPKLRTHHDFIEAIFDSHYFVPVS